MGAPRLGQHCQQAHLSFPWAPSEHFFPLPPRSNSASRALCSHLPLLSGPLLFPLHHQPQADLGPDLLINYLMGDRQAHQQQRHYSCGRLHEQVHTQLICCCN